MNLANAKLAGATFTYASFYSDVSSAPSFPCSTDTAACANPTGYTCNCATASGADLTRTDFSNAFLYGVDFRESTTTINGTNFSGAILTAASFDQANFVTDPASGGAAVDFSQALLQGTNLTGSTKLANSSLSGAFVNFGAPSNTQQGNIVFVLLPQSYTRFNGWAGATTPCVQMAYTVFTVAPPDAANMTCPDGQQPPGGCGTTLPGACPPIPPAQPHPNPNWASGVPIASNPVPGWYFVDATYDCAPVNLGAMCGGSGPSSDPHW